LALSNRDRISRALEILGGALTPFVDRHMAAFLPRDRDWLEVMTDRARREGRAPRMSRSDPRVLLRVIGENPRAFREVLSRLELAYAREIAEVANQWAHLEPFSEADTERALDTVMRFLSATGATAQASHIAELMPGRHPDLPSESGHLRQQGANPHLRSPDATLPAPDHGLTFPAVPAGAVVEFKDRDDAYLAWVAGHASGYVINIGRSGRGAAVLHHARCGTITSRPPFTGSYIKVCSPLLGPLDAWALQRNSTPAQRCGICHPPASSIGAPGTPPGPPARDTPPDLPSQDAAEKAVAPPMTRQQAGPKTGHSKYDPLRKFLAERTATPVTLSFAQLDQLVGTLPPSARLYP
jgi:hypothetical protein